MPEVTHKSPFADGTSSPGGNLPLTPLWRVQLLCQRTHYQLC